MHGCRPSTHSSWCVKHFHAVHFGDGHRWVPIVIVLIDAERFFARPGPGYLRAGVWFFGEWKEGSSISKVRETFSLAHI